MVFINHINKSGCCQENRIPFSFQKDHFEAARGTDEECERRGRKTAL